MSADLGAQNIPNSNTDAGQPTTKYSAITEVVGVSRSPELLTARNQLEIAPNLSIRAPASLVKLRSLNEAGRA